MIVPMAKVFLVARRDDRDRLLDSLRTLGVVHVEPVDPARALPDEATASAINDLERALQVLSRVEPSGESLDLSAADAAREVLEVQRRHAELNNCLVGLHRQLEQLEIWGDVELTQFEQIKEAGLDLRFYIMPPDCVRNVHAACVHEIRTMRDKRVLVAAIEKRRAIEVPDEADPVPLPSRDAPSVKAEAAQVNELIQKGHQRLAALARLKRRMQDELAVLQEQAEYSRVSKSGLSADKLYAVQGWLPQRQVDSLADDLKKANVDVAVETIEPAEDEQPPTLIEYPKWAQPIEGLFNILGTVPGYREFDVAAPFMIALPIFAAMLIADGGYGAILFLVPLLGYKKIAPAMGEQFTKLMIVIGGVALLWGFLCGSFFGVTIYDPPIPVNLTESSRRLLMHISFIMGAIHLAIAQLWQAVALYPNQRFLNKVGWAVFIWGVFGIVELFVLKNSFGWGTPWPYFLILGAILTIGFASDSTNWPKRFGLGVADFPLSLLSAFSDVISYVRLMAVGLASSVLAANFNELAFSVGFLPLTMLVLLFGHGLNLGLAMIALFAHGVRLNMLEFSNNLGMQWTGYAYNPFLKRTIQET